MPSLLSCTTIVLADDVLVVLAVVVLAVVLTPVELRDAVLQLAVMQSSDPFSSLSADKVSD